jgi:hypothetical protein
MNDQINIKTESQANLLLNIIKKFTFVEEFNDKNIVFYNIKLYEYLNDDEKIKFVEDLHKIYNTEEYNFIDGQNINGEYIRFSHQDIEVMKLGRNQFIESLKFIYTDFQIKSFLNMKYDYNIAAYIFGAKHLLFDPFNYSVITLYNEVYTYYNRIRTINSIAEVSDILTKDNANGIPIPNDLKVHYSPYDILKLLLSYEINFYELDELVFESWEKIVLSDINLNSVIGDFLIPNKTIPYLDRLDYKYTSAIRKELTSIEEGPMKTFINLVAPDKVPLKIKTYSTVDFVMAMFKKLNLFIGNDKEPTPNEIDINELYSLYSVLKPTKNIADYLVHSPKDITPLDRVLGGFKWVTS